MSMFYELMMRKKEQIMYATIKGTLTENDGVFSGFFTSNYLALQNSFKLNANTVAEFKVKINLTSNSIVSGIIGTPNSYGMNLVLGSDSKFTLYLGNGSSWNILSAKKGTTTIQANTDYYIRLLIDKGTITLLLSTDDITYTTEFTAVVTIPEEYTYNLTYGRARGNDQYTHGSIDLPNSYIKLGATKYKLQAVVGYTKVGSPTITDGVVSGFSSSDYVHINDFPNTFNSLEIVTKAKKSVTGNQPIFALQNGSATQSKFNLYFTNNGITFSYRSSLTNENKNISISYSVNVDVYYYFRLKISNSKIILGYSTDGTNWIEEEVEDTMAIASSMDFRFGIISNNAWYLDGSIDMNETYTKINNKLWFNGQQA